MPGGGIHVRAFTVTAFYSFLSRALPATPPAGLGKSPSEQGVEVAPELKSRDFFQSQRTLTQPERKGARDGLDFLIGTFASQPQEVADPMPLCQCRRELVGLSRGVLRLSGMAVTWSESEWQDWAITQPHNLPPPHLHPSCR